MAGKSKVVFVAASKLDGNDVQGRIKVDTTRLVINGLAKDLDFANQDISMEMFSHS